MSKFQKGDIVRIINIDGDEREPGVGSYCRVTLIDDHDLWPIRAYKIYENVWIRLTLSEVELVYRPTSCDILGKPRRVKE